MLQFKKKGLVNSGIATVLISIILYFHDLVDKFIAIIYQSWFDIFINQDKDELLRYVDIKHLEGSDISFLTYFINPTDVNLSQIKNIDINLFNEMYLPLALVSIVGAYFFAINKKLSIYIFLICAFVLWLKNLIVIYDNYTYPEYALIELPYIISGLVYYINSIVANVGQSLSLMMASVAIVVLIALNITNEER